MVNLEQIKGMSAQEIGELLEVDNIELVLPDGTSRTILDSNDPEESSTGTLEGELTELGNSDTWRLTNPSQTTGEWYFISHRLLVPVVEGEFIPRGDYTSSHHKILFPKGNTPSTDCRVYNTDQEPIDFKPYKHKQIV